MRYPAINRLIFNVGSAAYDAMTDQNLWRGQIAEVLQHVEHRDAIGRVLDLGCGPGVSSFVLAQQLPDATVDGIDLAPKMIARAKVHHARTFPHLDRVKFHVADATALPWPDQTFDLVVGHSFLYLVDDRHAVLEQIRRVLTPGGTLVLLEPHEGGSLRAATTRRFGLDFDGHPTGDIARFGLSMFAWRIVSGNVGRLDPVDVRRWLYDAGFDEAEVASTLGGLALHCIGRTTSAAQ